MERAIHAPYIGRKSLPCNKGLWSKAKIIVGFFMK